MNSNSLSKVRQWFCSTRTSECNSAVKCPCALVSGYKKENFTDGNFMNVTLNGEPLIPCQKEHLPDLLMVIG